MSAPTPTQCIKYDTTTYAKNLRIGGSLCVNSIKPCSGDSVYIEGLVLPPSLDCLTLSDTQTIVGCGASIGSGVFNTVVGVNAGNSVMSGISNTLIGYSSGTSLTSGNSNILLGNSSGDALTTGSSNIALGSSSGGSLTTGTQNILLGSNTGTNIIDGNNNVAIGPASLFSLTTGDANVAMGTSSGFDIVSGNDNVIIGFSAGINTSLDLSGCVLLGNEVGGGNVINNRLMIDNTNTIAPLIDGRFDIRTVSINGETTLGVDDTDMHILNTTWAATAAGAAIGFIRIRINGTIRRIPYFIDLP